MGAHTQKHPSAPGQTATGPLQPLSQQTSIVLPPTGTCCRNLLLRHVKAKAKFNKQPNVAQDSVLVLVFSDQPKYKTNKTRKQNKQTKNLHILSQQFLNGKHEVKSQQGQGIMQTLFLEIFIVFATLFQQLLNRFPLNLVQTFHCLKRTKPTDFGDSLKFPLAPTAD